MDKPISVQINEAKQNIVDCINEQHLHVSILEPIMKEIYEQVHMLAQQQYEVEKKQWEEQEEQKEV